MTGTELIRRMDGGEAFAVTTPLIKKADGSKFGKTEGGNVWLDRERTSPYRFYQYWLNASDEDAANYIRIFTLMDKAEIEALEKEHAEAPHARVMQNALANDITVRVHGEDDYNAAIRASDILFGKSTAHELMALSEREFMEVFDGVPMATVSRTELEAGMGIIDALSGKTGFLASNGEARRALKENAVSLNKKKVNEDYLIESKDLINHRYLLLQRGKKNYYVLMVE